MRSLAPASATPVTGCSPSIGNRPVRKPPSTRGSTITPRHRFSKPLKALVVLFVIVAVLHCSVLSGLIRWLAGPSPLDSLLFDGGSGGARPGEGRFSRPVGVGRKPGSDLLKALRQGAVRASASSAEETLGSWHDAVLPQLLSDRPAGLPPPLEGHDAFGGDESPGWGEIVRVLARALVHGDALRDAGRGVSFSRTLASMDASQAAHAQRARLGLPQAAGGHRLHRRRKNVR